ncbi:MAG: DUF2271 domain-containing protein [Pseudomonadota bacterium]|nr:DUF2271 domain-containing protein [Pseudomonadota bacterium]
MINKTTTRNFSEKPNGASFKSDGLNNMSLADKKKVLGEDGNVGDVLNKVADPNWVDPQKRGVRAPKNDMGKDAFMKLMLEQMKQQDPTNPLKSHEMAAQLAQFTSLEQLSNINQNIEQLRQGQEPNNNFQALNFIGKKVSGDGSRIIRADGDKSHEIRFDLKGEVPKINITISDMNGIDLKKIEINGPKKGENEVVWDGMAENGQPLRSGEYRVKFDAATESGKKIQVDTKFEGKVTGVNFTGDGPVLMVGNKSIRMTEIKKIEDSENQKEELKINEPTRQDVASSKNKNSASVVK